MDRRAKVRVALVGFGAIGRHHARNLASMAEVEFLCVVEPRENTRKEAADNGHPVVPDIETALALRPDAVVLAAPTALHYSLGMQIIEAGCALLVEKPIAQTVVEGEALIAAAAAKKVALTVGYVERYNPAISALRALISRGDLGDIFTISARRVGLMPPRITDANVLVDIGVHDIDIVSYLTNKPLSLVSALGGRAFLDDRVDYAVLAIDAAGIAVHIETNWITPVKVRELTVVGQSGLCQVDYIKRTARWKSRENLGEFFELPVEDEEPIRRELRHFVSTVSSGNFDDPRPSLESLRIAEEATISIENIRMEHHQ